MLPENGMTVVDLESSIDTPSSTAGSIQELPKPTPSSQGGTMGLNKFRNPLTPDSIARVGLPLYLFTISMVWYLGVTEVLPGVYEGWDGKWLFFQQALVTLMFVEMKINWFCIRYVTSSYQHYKTYVKPSPPVRRLGDEAAAAGEASSAKGSFLSAPARRRYPYWSWVPCYLCDFVRPPRCHHCPICRVCVVKKDHHCYFAGACVGWRNLRHFVVFNAWAALACLYAMAHSLLYIRNSLWSDMSYLDLFAPLAFVRWVLGYSSLRMVFLMTVELFLTYFVFLTTNFLVELLDNIAKGLTGFERGNLKSISIHDTRSLAGKIKSVFGEYYMLNLLFPMHFWFSPIEDPENYPFVKVLRH